MDAAPRSRQHPARGAGSHASTLRPLRQRERWRGAAPAVDHGRRNHRPTRSRRLSPRAPQPPPGRARRPRVRRRRDSTERRRRRLARRVRPQLIRRADRALRDRCRRHHRAADRHCAHPSTHPSRAPLRVDPLDPDDHHSNHHQRRSTDHEHHAPHRIIGRTDHHNRQHRPRAGRRPRRSPAGTRLAGRRRFDRRRLSGSDRADARRLRRCRRARHLRLGAARLRRRLGDARTAVESFHQPAPTLGASAGRLHGCGRGGAADGAA